VVAAARQPAGLEAILRLHLYLALRDVYPSSLQLDWGPAGNSDDRAGLLAQRCDFTRAGGRLLASGSQPDPLDRPIDPGRDLRLFVLVGGPPTALQIEAILCNRRGARRGQVLSLTSGKEGEVISELATWAAAVTGAEDPGPLAASWARDPVPGRPGLSRYGDVLVGSTGSAHKADLLLDEASAVVPEAAWLLSQLGNPRDSLAHLRRARLGRPDFTAAIEDRAALLFREDRQKAGLRELSLLPIAGSAPPSARPVRMLLASGLVDGGQSAAALAVLETLYDRERQGPSAARLGALANLALARDQPAAAQVEIWLAAQPRSGKALVAAGRLRAAAGHWELAQDAWERAVLDHPSLRTGALGDWAAAALDRRDITRLESTLAAAASGESDTGLDPFGLELQAYLAARGGRWSEALRIYDRLVLDGATSAAILQNRCHVALTSGQTDQAAGRCAGLTPAPLEGALASSAFDSRRPGALPGYPKDTEKAALHARRTAPADPAVSITALYSLGPQATPPEREDLLARWRVAVGPEHKVPEGIFMPRGPSR
jgi:tetratricopeptide (TPR) repeat protein